MAKPGWTYEESTQPCNRNNRDTYGWYFFLDSPHRARYCSKISHLPIKLKDCFFCHCSLCSEQNRKHTSFNFPLHHTTNILIPASPSESQCNIKNNHIKFSIRPEGTVVELARRANKPYKQKRGLFRVPRQHIWSQASWEKTVCLTHA